MREVFLDAFSWMDEFLHNFRARSFLWLVNQCLQLGFRRLRKAIVTPKMMIYLFVIYLTLLKAMDSKATIWPWIVVKDVQGFLQDYSGMYRGALQRAQDYLKPPARRENTIDYHYSLLAKVVAHTFSSGKRLAKAEYQIPAFILQLQPLNQVVPKYFQSRIFRNVSLQSLTM